MQPVIESADDVHIASASLAADHEGVRFIGVVAADDEERSSSSSAGSDPTAEVIFTAAVGRSDLAGADAAWLALERHWMGQDFVFTVPALADAVRYAVDSLTASRQDHSGRKEWRAPRDRRSSGHLGATATRTRRGCPMTSSSSTFLTATVI